MTLIERIVARGVWKRREIWHEHNNRLAPQPFEGPAKVTGRATYAAEFHPVGLAYAAIVESTIPASHIVAMDTAAVERAKGVYWS